MRAFRSIVVSWAALCLSVGFIFALSGCGEDKTTGTAEPRDPAVVAAEQKATQEAMKNNMSKKK